jgi:hypothetical protein
MAVDATPLWVAIGVLVVPNHTLPGLPEPPRAGGGGGDVAWRWVTSDAARAADAARYVVVPCPDGFSRRAWGDMQFSCFCKAAWWFRRALLLFPRARYLAKAEDDSVVRHERLVLELRLAAEAAAAAPPASGPPLHRRHVWYGHFAWAVHDGARGAYCGPGDETLRAALPHCRPGWSPTEAVLAPFASGGLDVRSRAFAAALAACDYVWAHLHHRDFEGDCDGLQGYFASLCLGNDRSSGNGGGAGGGGSGSDAGEVTALHLTVTKFHPPPADRHATILHPLKRPHPAHMSGASASGAAPLWAASGTGAAEPALLPLAFSLRPSAQHLSWEPHNRSVVERYLRHRETPRSLCRHVPCG